MNVLIWHVHGAWTTSFVHGPHTYLLPVDPDRSADGLGRARTYDWPDQAVELDRAQLADHPVDVVVLQRPCELDGLAERWRPWAVPHVLLGDQNIACAGCRARDCPVPGQPCLAGIRPLDVVEAVDQLAGASSMRAVAV